MNTQCPDCGHAFNSQVAPGLEGACPACMAKFIMAAPEDDITQVRALFPQLEIVERVGRGGMGVVYKARQPHLDRYVALKILPPTMAAEPDFVERFNREAKALAKLSHPNIVSIYDFGRSGDFFWLMMEFVDGTNLRGVLQAARLKPEEALKIVPQLCDALEYAHVEGVIHRDIKPENILVDKRGRVKIADFGLAKMVRGETRRAGLTQSNVTMGTPHYMAPEQVEDPKRVDHRADIYSMGVVFYEMLTGELPIGRFEPPSHKVQMDVRLDEVVLKALAKELDLRYQKISDVKNDVTRISSTAPAPAQPRRAWAPIAVAVLLGLVALVAVIKGWSTDDEKPVPTPTPPPAASKAAEIARFRDLLATTENRLADLRLKYADSHPEVQIVLQELAAIRKRLKELDPKSADDDARRLAELRARRDNAKRLMEDAVKKWQQGLMSKLELLRAMDAFNAASLEESENSGSLVEAVSLVNGVMTATVSPDFRHVLEVRVSMASEVVDDLVARYRAGLATIAEVAGAVDACNLLESRLAKVQDRPPKLRRLGEATDVAFDSLFFKPEDAPPGFALASKYRTMKLPFVATTEKEIPFVAYGFKELMEFPAGSISRGYIAAFEAEPGAGGPYVMMLEIEDTKVFEDLKTRLKGATTLQDARRLRVVTGGRVVAVGLLHDDAPKARAALGYVAEALAVKLEGKRTVKPGDTLSWRSHGGPSALTAENVVVGPGGFVDLTGEISVDVRGKSPDQLGHEMNLRFGGVYERIDVSIGPADR